MQGTDRGRFSCKTRNGNWFEESVLEDEKMREFLEKKEKGTLTIQKIRQSLAAVPIPQDSVQYRDNFLHYGQLVRIANGEVQAFVACDPGDLENPEEGLYSCSGSPHMETTARNVWVCKRYQSTNPKEISLALPQDDDDDVVRFGDEIVLSTTDSIGPEPFLLSSTKNDWSHFSRASRKQLVYATTQMSYKSVWKIDSVGRDSSFDMEGEPVELGQPVFIKHGGTNSPLAIHDASIYNDYGNEFELIGGREPGKRMIWRFIK